MNDTTKENIDKIEEIISRLTFILDIVKSVILELKRLADEDHYKDLDWMSEAVNKLSALNKLLPPFPHT